MAVKSDGTPDRLLLDGLLVELGMVLQDIHSFGCISRISSAADGVHPKFHECFLDFLKETVQVMFSGKTPCLFSRAKTRLSCKTG